MKLTTGIESYINTVPVTLVARVNQGSSNNRYIHGAADNNEREIHSNTAEGLKNLMRAIESV